MLVVSRNVCDEQRGIHHRSSGCPMGTHGIARVRIIPSGFFKTCISQDIFNVAGSKDPPEARREFRYAEPRQLCSAIRQVPVR